LLFSKGEAISGGNFHGEPIGFIMDFIGIALTEIAGISERRTYRLTDGKLNENLPPMLVDSPEDEGLNSGLMMVHYTAAALVLENRSLAAPDSVHSLPTSGSQEDHNANSLTAARHCYEILNNTIQVIAIELYIASRAIHIRLRDFPHAKLGKGSEAVFKCISDKVDYHPVDTLWGPEIKQVKELLLSGDLYTSIEKLL
jgi:histidine ammonia-lyase